MIRKYGKSKYYSLVAKESTIDKIKVTQSKDAYHYAYQMWDDEVATKSSISINESFWVIMLNQSNLVKGHRLISIGGITATVVDVQLIAKYAIDSLAKAVVLVHNHPSGEVTPSAQDRNITQKVKEALKLFEIMVIDHLIVVPEYEKFYSFADNGIL